MDVLALALYADGLLLTFGVRSVLRLRRTGSFGFYGIFGRPGSAARFGGVLFVLALMLGLAAPAAAAAGVVEPDAS